jgi:hypothetical protein
MGGLFFVGMVSSKQPDGTRLFSSVIVRPMVVQLCNARMS